mmetsp:Transcript_15191/g.22946  ORF Transcript_15191/g.22946 Transcript_15191/m.22946 type:complete len:118 (+) Transcript_15191:451-804(+)
MEALFSPRVSTTTSLCVEVRRDWCLAQCMSIVSIIHLIRPCSSLSFLLGKRSIFDGGYRVVQFLTGGWLDQAQPQQQPPQQGRKSDTFVFINDWAPTFLDMVGGSAAVHIFLSTHLI